MHLPFYLYNNDSVNVMDSLNPLKFQSGRKCIFKMKCLPNGFIKSRKIDMNSIDQLIVNRKLEADRLIRIVFETTTTVSILHDAERTLS